MADIEKHIKELALKGRDGKLTVEDLTGGRTESILMSMPPSSSTHFFNAAPA
jgi:pyruvate/2-oxoglutarate dehydrogenase complex dihydrolipoamide acyltransferase (E2) component